MINYNPQKIEKKWQNKWERVGVFKTSDKFKTRAERSEEKSNKDLFSSSSSLTCGNSKYEDKRSSSIKTNFYCLGMFPYPSAEGMHMGHCKNYTFTDLIAKFKKMNGFNVLHPMGWDAFGLPAENYALKTGIHPAISTKKAIKNIKKQLISVGFGYDWQKEICSSNSDYYKWTQWIFLQFYKAGLAYQKEAKANFCPSCKTVLANEQVVDGKCERCNSLVEKKYLKQWFFKITNYTERLLVDLKKINWPENIKAMQQNWIGKSEGTEIKFKVIAILGLKSTMAEISVFTTRADTLFGCTYIVIAPEHPLLQELKAKIQNWLYVEKYIKEAIKITDIERLAEDREKTGIECQGIKAVNPINNQEVPVFVADYVLLEYGTGAIMAVPFHDKRDQSFAKKMGLEIKEVIKKDVWAGDETSTSSLRFASPRSARVIEEDGILINSGQFSGLESAEARKQITKWLEKKKKGKKVICYKLRDWLISRQRYWGCPIPIIHCSKCGVVSVPEKDLPVRLPNIKDFKPSGDGESPLVKSEKFVNVKCPKCSSLAKRETDTLDTFVCSSWYFLRYPDAKNKKEAFNKFKAKNWLPVDLYVGGAEHAVLHLLYARFFTKALKDLGYLNIDEPFSKLFNQGMIYYQGAKMSKSKGNVIDPDETIKKYGADTVRLYECFMGPADQAIEWSDKGIMGCWRFLNRVWNLNSKVKNQTFIYGSKSRKENKIFFNYKSLEKLLHQTIKKVTEDIENFRFNTAISALMILINEFEKEKEISFNHYSLFLLLLAPFAPHISEELWQKLGYKTTIFEQKWPKYNPKLIKENTFTLIVQINGKVRDKIELNIGTSKEEVEKIILSQEKIKKWLEDKKVKKIIFIPNKLINIIL